MNHEDEVKLHQQIAETAEDDLTSEQRMFRVEKVVEDLANGLLQWKDKFEKALADIAKMQADQQSHAGALAAIADAVAQMGEAIRNQGDALRLVLPRKPKGPAN